MWFDSWSDLRQVLAIGAAAYVTVVLALRLSGKRTLAKPNAFDLVVTVAVGSTLATTLLNGDVSWTEGALAVALLASLQLLVAWMTTRLPRGRAVVTARAALLLRDGQPVPGALRNQRVTLDKVRQAVRSAGLGALSTVAAVVGERDGSMSVVSTDQVGGWPALQGVDGAEVDS